MTKTPVQKIDDGDIRGRLEDVSTHTMIQIRPSMMPFFWERMEQGRNGKREKGIGRVERQK